MIRLISRSVKYDSRTGGKWTLIVISHLFRIHFRSNFFCVQTIRWTDNTEKGLCADVPTEE
jgi:hypothetical protein